MGDWQDYGLTLLDEQHPRYWRALLEQWHRLIRRYCRVVRDAEDFPFFHGERANVGILAAAAWYINRVALQEVPVVRNRVRHGAQQVDLWIGGSESVSDVYEAKYVKVGPENASTLANRRLEEACHSVSTLTEQWYDGWRIGMVFCPIELEGAGRGDVRRRAAKVLEDLESLNPSALAWAFPRSRVGAADPVHSRTGVFLLLKIEPRHRA